MACQKCSSENQSTFNGEVGIHFPGLEGLNKSLVFVYPKLAVCLNCGFTEFTVPERQLRVLQHDTAVDDAIVLTERIERVTGTAEKFRHETIFRGILPVRR
jgi:hypothetical protein